MVANKVFNDPRGVNCVYCYTDTAIPLDSIITFDGVSARISKVFTAEEGWNPGPGNSNQGVIGFNYTGQNYTYGDTFNVTNGSFTLPVSSYAAAAAYGYLNFTSYVTDSGLVYPGSNIYAEQNYLNVGTNDFTIEFVARLNTLRQNQTFFSFEGSGGFPTSSIFGLLKSSSGLSIILPGFSPFTIGGSFEEYKWYHIALVRISEILYVYLDGIQIYSVGLPYDYSNITTTRFGVIDVYGYSGLTTVYGLSGAMSNIRITANEALYTTEFTPPTLPLTAGPNTTLLMLADSEANKYVNSVDNVVFTNVNNPTTGEPVYWTNGPIPYPPPPPTYYVYWTPSTDLISWYTEWDGGGPGTSNIDSVTFNTTSPGFDNFSQVYGLSFNAYETNITSLTGLYYLTNLQYLAINSPQSSLSSIDISQNLNLTKLDLAYIPTLTSIDTTNNLLLTSLNLYECGISELNINNNTLLNILNLTQIPIKSIDLSNFTLLNNFSLTNCQLSSVQGLQALDNVTYFTLNYNPLSSVNINDMDSLIYAYLDNNNLTSLVLSSCPSLGWLGLPSNSFTEVPDFSNAANVFGVVLQNNLVREFNPNYSSNILERINISFNNTLSSINLINFPSLQNVSLNYCNLSALDLSFINRPQDIFVNNNNLTSLFLPVSTQNFWAIGSSIIISNNISLTNVSVSGVKQIYNLDANYCSFSQNVVDRLFNEVADNVAITNRSYGICSIAYGNNAAPSSASSSSRSFLASKGWILYFNT